MPMRSTSATPKRTYRICMVLQLSCAFPGAFQLCLNRNSWLSRRYPSQQRRAQYGSRSRIEAVAGVERDTNNTLYSILHVSPNATQADIRRAYIALARQTHPDAQLQMPNNASAALPPDDSFLQISDAYQTLSDPVERIRYDRSLAAAAFTSDFESMLDRWTDSAGKPMMRALDSVALPFLRRSAATAVATLASATQDILGVIPDSSIYNNTAPDSLLPYSQGVSSDYKNNTASSRPRDLSQVLAKAIRAGQRANRAIDQLELRDKSRDIQRRVLEEQAQMILKQNEWNSLLLQRFSLTLSTPRSQITSMDAWTILERLQSTLTNPSWNHSQSQNHTQSDRTDHEDPIRNKNSTTTTTTHSFSFLESMLQKRPIEYHIEQLQHTEDECNHKMNLQKQIQQTLDEKEIQLQDAQHEVDLAIQAEVDARKALEEAIQRVSTSKARLGHVTKARSLTEEAFYRIKGDIQKMDPVLERKQERVRVELLRKQESSQHPKDIGPMDAATVGTFTPVSIWDPALLQLHPKDQGGDVVLDKIMNDSQRIQFHQNQIQDLRRRQEELEGEIESMQLKISRMNSRAQKLMERCQEYDNL